MNDFFRSILPDFMWEGDNILSLGLVLLGVSILLDLRKHWIFKIISLILVVAAFNYATIFGRLQAIRAMYYMQQEESRIIT